MADWKFWKGFLSGAVVVILTIFALIEGVDKVKSIFSKPAKPQILEAQNCSVTVRSKIVAFDLLVNNPDSKDCSIISIDLLGLNGSKVDLQHISLPKTILSGQTERIMVAGDFRGKLELQPDQNTVEGTVVVRFNTNDIIKKSISFTLYH